MVFGVFEQSYLLYLPVKIVCAHDGYYFVLGVGNELWYKSHRSVASNNPVNDKTQNRLVATPRQGTLARDIAEQTLYPRNHLGGMLAALILKSPLETEFLARRVALENVVNFLRGRRHK